MTIDLAQFHQVFFEETEEHLATMESLLLGLEIGAPDPEQLNAIFRAAHSIKGSSGTFGFTDLAEVTHVLENLLDRIRKGELALREEMIDAFLAAGDLLGRMLAAHRGGEAVDPAETAGICARLESLGTADVAPADGQPAGAADDGAWGLFEEESAPTADAAYGFFDSAETAGLDAIPSSPQGHFSAASTGIPDTQPSQDAEGYGFFGPDTPAAVPAVPAAGADEAFGFFDDPPPVPATIETMPAAPRKPAAAKSVPAKPAPAKANGDATIRVGIEKVDQLINLVGELVITQAMLLQSASGLDPVQFERLHTGLSQLERNSRDLQEAVMSIRMMPISVVFSRFPRVVRELSQKLGKKVELRLEGEGTELDKGLIERITDPLTHLVRNSLDHGIEMPDVRAARGKPPAGTITLRASHQGGNIVIEVSDDGAGLNRERILAKARERGLPAHEQMSDQEVWQLIFEAGFSTAEQVTEVSGRGVGMDVVKRNIQAMGGRIEIDSAAGLGTRMTVRLPLTLAILDGMSVAVGRETYILPLGCVVESLQADPAMVRSISGVSGLLAVRGEYLPIVPLHQVFAVPGAVTDFTHGIMVVAEADGSRVALFVDALVGQQQVVIKSLEANYRKVAGVSGATILGDGRVALILDVAALAGMARNALPAAA